MDVFLKLIANVLIVFVIAFQVVKQLDALAMLEDTDNSTYNINILGQQSLYLSSTPPPPIRKECSHCSVRKSVWRFQMQVNLSIQNLVKVGFLLVTDCEQ